MEATRGRPKLTDEQRQAVGVRDSSVALSAGAGCGKTLVLTERFLSHVDPAARSEPPSELRRIVAITFTERAAREMRDRLRSACYERLRSDDAGAPHWLRLLREMEGARISTIHSFCGSLLRAHATEVGLDPAFSVLDQAQSATLLSEVIDEQLRQQLADKYPALLSLVVRYDLKRVRRMIYHALSNPGKLRLDDWRDASPNELIERWANYRSRVAVPAAAASLARLPAARALVRLLEVTEPSHPQMQVRRAVLLERLRALGLGQGTYADFDTIRDHARVQGGGNASAWPSRDAYDTFLALAKELREKAQDLQDIVSPDIPLSLAAAEAGLWLAAVVGPIGQRYLDRKRELSALDFDDLLIRARDLLCYPAHDGLRREVAGQIDMLLVDEFQDTDPVQAGLIKALAIDVPPAGRLFFVGDSKQSIYRFRGADPEVFHALGNSIPQAGRLSLTQNFRSQPAILDFVNALFCEQLDGQYEPLRPRRPQVSPLPAIEFLWVPTEESRESPETLRQREADWIARRLRAILDSPEPILWDEAAARSGTPALRRAGPGDIAILFRTLSNVDLYEAALERYGIEYYLVGGHAFYAQQEIFDILNLLRALWSRCDEVSLAGALRSPLFALTDESLFWLSQAAGGLSEALLAERVPPQLDQEQAARVKYAAQTLRELRELKDRVGVAALIQSALDRTGYDAILLSEFMGERKLANLRKLVDQARRFDATGHFGLADFIVQLSEFVVRQPEEALAATQPESTDVVRLMTVHQSKGLEFPIVVVPDIDRPAIQQGPPVLMTDELGLLVPSPSALGEDDEQTDQVSGYQLVRRVESVAEDAERRRLLYVATTRAADYLILSAGVRSLEGCVGPWRSLLADRYNLATGEMRPALPAGIEPPQIRVTTARPECSAEAIRRPKTPDLAALADRVDLEAGRGVGEIPPHVGPVQPDLKGRLRLSFSALEETLQESWETADQHADSPSSYATRALHSSDDALVLGTLVHGVLAELPLDRAEQLDLVVKRQANRLGVRSAELSQRARKLVDRFLQSPRAEELRRAVQVHREVDFLLRWPLSLSPEPQARYFEGSIDCLYRSAAGGWRLVDYKTNDTTSDRVSQLAAHYQQQLWLYGLAAERVLGEPPEELVLHFLVPGVEHRWKWTSAAREQAISAINEAAEAFLRSTG